MTVGPAKRMVPRMVRRTLSRQPLFMRRGFGTSALDLLTTILIPASASMKVARYLSRFCTRLPCLPPRSRYPCPFSAKTEKNRPFPQFPGTPDPRPTSDI